MLKKTWYAMLFASYLFCGVAFAQSKININTANQTELETLKGVGPSTAKAIIEYRKANGNFKSTKDIIKVKGIGDKKYKMFAKDIQIEATK